MKGKTRPIARTQACGRICLPTNALKEGDDKRTEIKSLASHPPDFYQMSLFVSTFGQWIYSNLSFHYGMRQINSEPY